MTKLPDDQERPPTAYENFLYILAEMEWAVQRGNIKWPADQGDVILIRLARIASRVALGFGRHDREQLN